MEKSEHIQASTPRGRILIIEDDHEVVALIERALKELGYSTDATCDGKIGLERALAGGFDLLLLDITLPDVNGFDICHEVRARYAAVPIVFVTSRDEVNDRVQGLTSGGDDYIIKPFDTRELAARVNNLLRRTGLGMTGVPTSKLQYGPLTIDAQNREVRVDERLVELTTLEFDLLLFFAVNPGKLFSRKDLMRELWGYECSQFGPTITSYFSRLRAKLEKDPKNPRYIRTVHGSGYRFTGHLPHP